MPMDYEESDSALLGDPVEETGDTGAGGSSLATVGPRANQVYPENSPIGS